MQSEEEEEVIYEEVLVDDEGVEVEEEIVEEDEMVSRTPSTHASESDYMSDQGWSDRDDATSTGDTRDSAGNDSVGDDDDPLSPLGGGDPLSPLFAQEAAPPLTPTSTSTKKGKHKKKKPKRGQRGPDADGYHGREIDMDHVKETGKDYYKRLKEAEIARKAEMQRKLRENQARAKRMTLAAIKRSKRSLPEVEEDNESEHTVDFIDDPIEEMTYARRFALNWLYKKDWYRKLANYTTDDFYMEEEEENADNNKNTNKDGEAGGTGKSTRSNRSMRSKRKSSRMTLDNKSIHSMVFDTRDDEAEKPSLARAWAYFEHVSLDRYIVNEKEEEEEKNKEPEGCLGRLFHRFFMGERELRRAAPGTTEVKTRLFDPFNTPHSQLGNFGIAVGLYFSTVRIVGLICFIAGLINSYSMWYFATDAYMPAENRENLPLLLKGSAICNYTSWVPCPECNCADNPDDEKNGRCTVVNDTLTGELLTFGLKNNCEATVWAVAATNYVSVIFIMISIVGLGIYLQYEEVIFDEDQQTTQDYSIRITNPPGDATDPEEWRTYFREQCDGAQVTVCTCALDNDLLIQALVKRRETFRSIRNALPAGTPLDVLSLAQIAAEQERKRSVLDSLIGKILPGVPENFAFLVIMNARIQALAQLKYYTTQIYISFEKEEHQRHVLETLTVGSVRAKRNVKSALPDPKYLFRGKYVLNVEKATEPNTIHWDSLNVSGIRKVLQQTLTNLITLGSIICVALVVKAANEWNTLFAALMISGFNAGFPEAAKIIVLLESHDNEGSKQRSLFFKIAAFRWVNTAIVISIITPFTRTLAIDSGLLTQVAAIFLSEIVTLNIIQLTDAYGHFRRLCVAPFMQNQDAMNLWFRGEEVELAERYTNMTKIFFLALWYSSILPGGFFMAALALFINYFTDRFGIMRTWKRAAHLGSEVSFISRKYFFSLANVAMAFISAYYWAGFPFDNLCDSGKSVDPNSPYVGNYTVVPDPEEPDETSTAKVSGGETVWEYCSQDMFVPFTFPFIPSQQEGRGAWMTPTQEQITTIFGWSSLGVLFVVAVRILSGVVKGYFKSIRGRFRAIGDVQGIDFSEVPLISAYIPQVETFFFSYPLVVCDTDAFRKSLFDWEDPEKPHSYYDLTKDADALMADEESFHKDKCFSRVRYWRPGDE